MRSEKIEGDAEEAGKVERVKEDEEDEKEE